MSPAAWSCRLTVQDNNLVTPAAPATAAGLVDQVLGDDGHLLALPQGDGHFWRAPADHGVAGPLSRRVAPDPSQVLAVEAPDQPIPRTVSLPAPRAALARPDQLA